MYHNFSLDLYCCSCISLFLLIYQHMIDAFILLELFRAMVPQGCLIFLFNIYCQRGSLPIFNCSNKHSTNSQKWAFLIPFNTIPISPGTKQENTQCNDHQNTRDSKSQTPTNIVLYIAQDKNCYRSTPTYTKIPPVEE